MLYLIYSIQAGAGQIKTKEGYLEHVLYGRGLTNAAGGIEYESVDHKFMVAGTTDAGSTTT